MRENNFKTRMETCEYTPEAKTLQEELRAMRETKTPIEGGATLYYTDKKAGVMPEFDCRTDKWDIACEAGEKVYGLLTEARKNGEYVDANGNVCKAQTTETE